MNLKKPPTVATWLLERVVGKSARTALIGDLFEDYHEHGSTLGYWRQVLVAAGLACAHDISRHKWLAMRALLTAALGYQLVWWLYASLIGDSYFHLLWAMPGPLRQPTVIALRDAVPTLLVGFLVGRLHRQHAVAMVVAVAGALLLCQLPEGWRRLDNVLIDWRYSPAFADFAIQVIVGGVALVIGGLLVRSDKSEFSSASPAQGAVEGNVIRP